MKMSALALVIVAATWQQQQPSRPSANPNLGAEFVPVASRAAQAISKDQISKDLKADHPTDDRIDEADQQAKTHAEKDLIELLRSWYLNKQMHNAIREAKRMTAELDTRTNAAQYVDEDDRKKAVQDALAQDRDLAKADLDDQDCLSAIEQALKTRIYRSAPPSCGHAWTPEQRAALAHRSTGAKPQ